MKISSIHITPISKFQKPSLFSFEGRFLDKILGGLKKDVFEKSRVDEVDISDVNDISQKELEKTQKELVDKDAELERLRKELKELKEK